MGYVLCHDGKIFRYTAPEKETISYYYRIEVAKGKQNGYNEYESQLEAMKKLSKSCGFLVGGDLTDEICIQRG